jgi:hypothetical protein
MTIELARTLFGTGRAHAYSSCLLYRASVEQAADDGFEDPVSEVFNGQNSLSIMHLLGLGLELMLKSAVLALDPEANEKYLRDDLRHDLVKALDAAEARGFVSNADHLRDIAAVLRDPYGKHWFRYGRPEEFALPDNFDQVVETLKMLDDELTALFTAAPPEATAGA